MLVAEPVRTSAQQRCHCLDVLKVVFEDASQAITEDAILLEIGEPGGLLQTGRDMPRGTSFRLGCNGRDVLAKADSSVKDDYGYLVEFTVDPQCGWFPEAYRPPYLLEQRDNSASASTSRALAR
jgi:hypothetical protein